MSVCSFNLRWQAVGSTPWALGIGCVPGSGSSRYCGSRLALTCAVLTLCSAHTDTRHATSVPLLATCPQDEQGKLEKRKARMAERSIDAQRASATVPRDTVQLYASLREAGLEYGPAFRLLRNVHVPDTA